DAMWDMLSGYELAMVLPLAEHLPDEEKAEALEKALRIEDRGARIEAVGRIMGCLPPSLRVEAAREAWPVILRMAARRPRGEAVGNLVSLAPFIAHLGGGSALRELFLAIRDVTQWWP
ncbi:MAG: hypothetical protein JW850_13885, partial [Thermoflexales bacterium]|nr:hypothetical protein [Thermoflexales bacterium]